MIALFILIFVQFFVSIKLRPYFGRLGWFRASVSAFFAATSALLAVYFFRLDLLGIPASNLNVSKIPALYISLAGLAIFCFLLDLLLIYSAKFLNWLHEFLANFFKNRK